MSVCLVTLWDLMEQFHAGIFMQHVRNIEHSLHRVSNGERALASNVHVHIQAMQAKCAQVGLPVAGAKLADADHVLRGMWGNDAWKQLGSIGTDFATTVALELRAKKFVQLTASRAEYFSQLQPFSEKVNERFPSAIDDIEGAAKCLALDQGTACVLHLMRVMEVGLKTLAAPLGVPYAPSWESYLTQIARNIAIPHGKKPPKWKKHEPFFRDVSGDLVNVKQAFRNPTMHVGRKYSPDEAEDIFRAVRAFMQRLEAGIPTKRAKRQP